MYRVDIQNKKLIKLKTTSYSECNLKERFDIQEWIADSPEILGEPLLIIAKELYLSSGRHLDLLAVDKNGALVIIELKRDSSGSSVEWQAIKYTSYCAVFDSEVIYEHFAKHLGKDKDDAQAIIDDFIECELTDLNQSQRIILVSKEFHPEVISAVVWLREFEINIECIRLRPYLDQNEQLYIDADIIIPLPEAKDYMQKKDRKNKIMTSNKLHDKFPGYVPISLT